MINFCLDILEFYENIFVCFIMGKLSRLVIKCIVVFVIEILVKWILMVIEIDIC